MGCTNVGTTDNGIELGLETARLSYTISERLEKSLPPVGTSVGNPAEKTTIAGLLVLGSTIVAMSVKRQHGRGPQYA